MHAGNRIVATALGALCLGTSAGLAANSASPTTLKPLMGARFETGSKQILGYFLPISGACKVTLMVAEAAPPEGEGAAQSVARVQFAIDAGGAARFDAADGGALVFACSDAARALEVAKIDRFAAAPTAP